MQMLCSLLLSLTLCFPLLLQAADGPVMVFATVGNTNKRVRVVEGQLDDARPGWFIELSRKAAVECGAEADFIFMPWARALNMVEQGNVSAAFNSSYKPERANYGVYPMKDGALDESRASKHYVYYAYVAQNSSDQALLDHGDLKGRSVVTERGASVIPELEQRQANVKEVANYLSMLRMVAGGHVDAAIGIGQNLDPLLKHRPDLGALVRRVEVPVQKRIGYVMFSKPYYAEHRDLVECYWTRAAELRESNWFKAMFSSYQ